MRALTTNSGLGTWSRCCSGLAALSRGAAKATKAKLRQAGFVHVSAHWPRRAAACEMCPLRVLQGGVTYCGKPFLHQPVRDEVADGCGCPTVKKAKDPDEHCPLNVRHQASTRDGQTCDCKWCALTSDQ